VEGDRVGPLVRLRVPDFKGMGEKYKKKLEEVGYPSDQPQGASISR
jgi:hypothetical protein